MGAVAAIPEALTIRLDRTGEIVELLDWTPPRWVDNRLCGMGDRGELLTWAMGFREDLEGDFVTARPLVPGDLLTMRHVIDSDPPHWVEVRAIVLDYDQWTGKTRWRHRRDFMTFGVGEEDGRSDDDAAAESEPITTDATPISHRVYVNGVRLDRLPAPGEPYVAPDDPPEPPPQSWRDRPPLL